MRYRTRSSSGIRVCAYGPTVGRRSHLANRPFTIPKMQPFAAVAARGGYGKRRLIRVAGKRATRAPQQMPATRFKPRCPSRDCSGGDLKQVTAGQVHLDRRGDKDAIYRCSHCGLVWFQRSSDPLSSPSQVKFLRSHSSIRARADPRAHIMIQWGRAETVGAAGKIARLYLVRT